MMKKSDLTDVVKTSPEMPRAPDDTVEETVEFLHASGEVCIHVASLMELIQCLTLYIQVFLVNYLALLDVPWMSHSLLGPVMAPPEFPVHLEAAAKSRREEGTATKEEICTVIRNFRRRQGKNPDDINTEYAMNALDTLGVMFELPDRPGVFCIPSHLPYKDRNEMWPEHPRKIAYVGRRIECRRNIDTFTSAFFVFLQSRLAVIIDRKAFLWKGGLKVAHVIEEEAIECLVELKNYDTVVDLVARGSEKSQHHCLAFLVAINDILIQMLRTKSPGSQTRMYLLHPPDLVARAVEPFGFSEDEVEEARLAGSKVVIAKNKANGQFVEVRLDELMATADGKNQRYSSLSKGGKAESEQFQPPSPQSSSAAIAGEQHQVSRPSSSPSSRQAAADRDPHPLSSLPSVQTVVDEYAQASSLSAVEISVDEHVQPISLLTRETTEEQSRSSFSLPPFLRAVQKRGSNRWFALAVAMGYEGGEISVICYEKISFPDKVLAVFMKKREEVGIEEAELALEVACREIEPPIYEAVKEELDKGL